MHTLYAIATAPHGFLDGFLDSVKAAYGFLDSVTGRRLG